jgi:hypothetical protein
VLGGVYEVGGSVESAVPSVAEEPVVEPGGVMQPVAETASSRVPARSQFAVLRIIFIIGTVRALTKLDVFGHDFISMIGAGSREPAD